MKIRQKNWLFTIIFLGIITGVIEKDRIKDAYVTNKYIDALEDTASSEYPSQEYYLTEEEKNNIIKASKTKKECRENVKWTINTLINQIEQNTKTLDDDNYRSIFVSDYTNGEVRDGQIKIEYALRNILNEYLTNKEAYDNDDFHELSKIKVVVDLNKDEKTLGHYNYDTKVVALCIDNIKVISYDEEEYYQNILNVLEHELNHVRQHACSCKIEQGQKYNSVNYTNNVTFLEEASAESSLSRDNNEITYGYTYYELKNFENALMLLNLANMGYDTSEYYNAIYGSDLSSLYKFFGLENAKDIKEFYDIIYSIDGIHGRNNFINDCFGDINVTQREIEKKIGKTYLSHLYKMIVKGLIKKTSREEVSLEDNLFLHTTAMNILLGLAPSYDGNTKVYDEMFNKEFIDIQNVYYRFIKDYYNVSYENIRNLLTTDVYNSIQSIMIYVDGDKEYLDDVKVKMTEELLSKYPYLAQLYFTSFVYVENYKLYLDNNDLNKESVLYLEK